MNPGHEVAPHKTTWSIVHDIAKTGKLALVFLNCIKEYRKDVIYYDSLPIKHRRGSYTIRIYG